jgi:hypothetical protein
MIGLTNHMLHDIPEGSFLKRIDSKFILVGVRLGDSSIFFGFIC